MSDLARKLIAENKKTQRTFLDLGNCGLTELPAKVGELVWLESLCVAAQWFEWKGRGWAYHRTENTGDQNQGVVNLALLSRLRKLQSLIIDDMEVDDLSPLAGLPGLQTLHL